MKKFLSLLLVAVLVSAIFAVPVSADDEYFWAEGEYTIDDSGNWHPNNAWGYVFNIDALNTLTVDGNAAITGIFTNVDDYLANAGGKNAKWKAHIILAPTDEANVYEVVQGYEYTGKTAQEAVDEGIVSFENGKIILMASDSGTRPDKNDDGALLFPNWEDRAACWGLVKTIGAKLTLAGVDLAGETGACTGTLTVEAKPASGNEGGDVEAPEAQPFFVSHINGVESEGWGVVYTEKDSAGAWCSHVSFAPVEGLDGVYEVVEINHGSGDGSGSQLAVPAGGFVWAGHAGNPPYNNPGVAGTLELIKNWNPGDRFTFQNLDLDGGKVATTTPDKKWYDEGYVCTTTVTAYVPEAVKPAVLELISSGKSYTGSELFRQDGANISYPDESGKDMTDGVLPPEGAKFSTPEFAGWNAQLASYKDVGYNWITIDLGESYDVAKYVLWYGTVALGAGINAPTSIEIYVSADGENWGDAVGSAVPVNTTESINECVTIEGAANGRYVQFRFQSRGWAFISEAEVYGYVGGNSGTKPEQPKEDVEAEMKELLGAAPADAKVDYVIDAPAEYKAGDEITVTVTVKNITAENGIHVAAFKLLYDNEKLLITNDLDEEDENALVCVKTLPKDWENLSSVANDYNADNEEGTVVNPLNDGVINVSVFTAKSAASAAIKEDGALVLEFTFKALEDAEGDIGLVIPNETAECAFNGKEGEIVYEANGSYAVIKAPVVEEESKPEPKPEDPVKPGDASSMIIFAIIALVAICGSAVVIKTRK